MSELQIRKIVYAMLQAGLVEVIQPAVAPATRAHQAGGRHTPEVVCQRRREAVGGDRLIDRIKRI